MEEITLTIGTEKESADEMKRLDTFLHKLFNEKKIKYIPDDNYEKIINASMYNFPFKNKNKILSGFAVIKVNADNWTDYNYSCNEGITSRICNLTGKKCTKLTGIHNTLIHREKNESLLEFTNSLCLTKENKQITILKQKYKLCKKLI